MTPIETWKARRLNSLVPIRIIATIEPRCNLACSHCYWSHEMDFTPISNWENVVSKLLPINVPLFFAGRVLTRNGAEFLRLCIERGATKGIGIIDNGSTILKFPELLKSYNTINISIDGWREQHDIQRGKIGSFDTAWNTILKLKEQGLDPVVSSAISPITTSEWSRLEKLLADNDVPMSSTLVWALPNTKERGVAVFDEGVEMRNAFLRLLNGIPKLINIYSLDQVRVLWPILKDLSWVLDTEVGDCISSAQSNGTVVIYRPTSLTSVSEYSLEWDGLFYTPFTYGMKRSVDMIDDSYFDWVKKVNDEELDIWSKVL